MYKEESKNCSMQIHDKLYRTKIKSTLHIPVVKVKSYGQVWSISLRLSRGTETYHKLCTFQSILGLCSQNACQRGKRHHDAGGHVACLESGSLNSKSVGKVCSSQAKTLYMNVQNHVFIAKPYFIHVLFKRRITVRG